MIDCYDPDDVRGEARRDDEDRDKADEAADRYERDITKNWD